MLSEAACREIREHLARSQKPVFYYDNDADGLCSFLLFARFLGRGEGVAIRSYPALDASYARKAQEAGADAVFILDKPVLDAGFVEALRQLAIPVIWIDHHETQGSAFPTDEPFFAYNPLHGRKKSSEPVTYWAQRVCRRADDLWIAVMGCIADHYLPDFADDFASRFPELWGIGIQEPFDAYYRTEIGTLARALNFGLKDSASNVVRLQHYLLACRTPCDVLAEVPENVAFRHIYTTLLARYHSLFMEAERCRQNKLLFFSYSGATSMSAELANELRYRFPQCVVAVAYVKGGVTNLSLRGARVSVVLERILPRLTSASGGGHEDAVGARIQSSELALFCTLLEHEIQGVGHGNA